MLEKIDKVGRDSFFFFFTIIIKYIWTFWLSLDVSKSTDRMANSVDPDQTAPVGAV